MKQFPFFFFLLILVSSCATLKHPARIKYASTKLSIDTIPVQRILIVGSGASPTRLFMDKLSASLTRQFNVKKTVCEYFYFGAATELLTAKLGAHLADHPYDVVLVFSEQLKSAVHNYSQDYTYSPMGGNLYGASVGIREKVLRYDQQFLVKTFIPGDLNNSIWESAMRVSFDFLESDQYEKISKLIIASFVENNMIK